MLRMGTRRAAPSLGLGTRRHGGRRGVAADPG